ncbi:hypothetical protein CMI37_09645 [Candidatus Pacearchaeota archaeon]|nr:hypothetical protein [Candidatus Pacearchaeota archaeon]|tara:strand:- start:3091 stop:3918 length:828 start_codon:yes stop_codon:yes gene_type:complete
MNLKKIAYQVVVSTRNNGKTIHNCLSSIDSAMNEFNKEVKWILVIGDADSQDDTLIEIGKYAENSSADKIHLFDYDYHEKKGVNENKLINELHDFGENYPLILFTEPDGEMTMERPMMVFTALTYDVPWVVGGWKAETSQSGYSSKEAADSDFYGPWATLFHISALPKDNKLFYETVNKGRDVLAWKQLKHIQDIKPTPHVRDFDCVHKYSGRECSGIRCSFGGQATIRDEQTTNDFSFFNPQDDPEDYEQKETKLFLGIKSQLEKGNDILKDVV